MAEPWALRQKALKKRVYTALIEGRNLRRAACLHALSRPEIGHLRAIAPRTPVCLVPNGVNLEPFDNLPGREQFEAEHPELTGKFVILFMARLHVKKGLDLLAEAVSRLAQSHPEIHLLIAGPDDGALPPFLGRAQALGISKRITLLSHVSGNTALQAWGSADAFVLPSYSEGFSMAVLEALACRLPVVITTACHFPELAQSEAGITVSPTIEGVTSGLTDLVSSTPAERTALGARGRSLVETRYTWARQAERLAEVYRWVAGGGDRPEAVRCAES
jgi:glycosyltransferase involved in cell wall biosynthesis